MPCQPATQEIKASRRGQSHWEVAPTEQCPKNFQGYSQAILAVVLKPAALTNNSESDNPTLFPAPIPAPSLTKEALQAGLSK